MTEEIKRTTQDILNINGALHGTQQLDKNGNLFGLQGLLYIKGIGVGKMALVKLSQSIKLLIEAYNIAVKDIQEKYKPDDKGIMSVENQKAITKDLTELLKQEETVILPKIKVSFLEKIPEVIGKHLDWLFTVLEE